jgi:hypothetical protein
MSLSLICACGARIPLDDALAGTEVACPECQQLLKAPAVAQSPAVRTSAFALASLVLALVGAFTLVGTLAAIACGLIAVATILRDRERLAGLGFAVAGIALGFLFTALTAFALFGPKSFSVGDWVREKNMAGFVDHSGPLEVAAKGCTITRPGETWGVARRDPVSDRLQVGDPVAEIFLKKGSPDAALVQIRRHGFVDVRQDSSEARLTANDYQIQLQNEYQTDQDLPLGGANPKGKDEGITHAELRKSWSSVSAPEGYDGRQAELEVIAGDQRWTLILRFYRGKQEGKDAGRVYILRAYAPYRRAKENHPDFDKALDSFRLVK